MSKSIINKLPVSQLSLLPLALAFIFSPASIFAQCQSCVTSVTLPTAAVQFSSVTQTSTPTQLASTGAGYFALTLSGVAPGSSLANQTYAAWCAGWWNSPVQTSGSAGFPVSSTYSPSFPSTDGPLVAGSTINMVNYILNHKQGTLQDVQDAIWTIMTGVTEDVTPSSTALAMVSAAQANSGYVPDGGGTMAVVIEVGGPVPASVGSAPLYYQNLFFEVPVLAPTVTCSGCINSVTLPGSASYSSLAANTAPGAPASTGGGFFAATLSGVGAGFSISNLTYAAWCAGWWSSPAQTASGTSGPVYSTYSAAFPAIYASVMSGSNYNEINYILNHKSGTVADVQDAIWMILTGSNPDAPSSATLAMVAAATANPTYCPPTGGTIALFLAVTQAPLAADSNAAKLQYQNLLIEIQCNGITYPGTPGLTLKKTASAAKVNPFQKVTYTYVVKNSGSVTLNNIVVVDDNATPGYTSDDFTVGTIATLAPGASATLTATIYPPVQEASNADSGWGLGWGWSWWNPGWGFDYNSAQSGGVLICKDLGNKKVQFTYREHSQWTDNSYGSNSGSDWGWWGHSFSSMAANDGAEFQICDKNGAVQLDFVADYCSPTSGTKSGYGTLGVKGGGGMVYKGSSASVLRVETSLSRNINSKSKYFNCTQNSPAAGTPDWEFKQSYTVTVDTSACGAAGFGGVKIPINHNSPAKVGGCNSRVMHPVSSTATNTAVASVTYGGTVISATATATVTIDASPQGWSQCGKY